MINYLRLTPSGIINSNRINTNPPTTTVVSVENTSAFCQISDLIAELRLNVNISTINSALSSLLTRKLITAQQQCITYLNYNPLQQTYKLAYSKASYSLLLNINNVIITSLSLQYLTNTNTNTNTDPTLEYVNYTIGSQVSNGIYENATILELTEGNIEFTLIPNANSNPYNNAYIDVFYTNDTPAYYVSCLAGKYPTTNDMLTNNPNFYYAMQQAILNQAVYLYNMRGDDLQNTNVQNNILCDSARAFLSAYSNASISLGGFNKKPLIKGWYN